MTELQELQMQKKEIERKIKNLTGSMQGIYIKHGNVRFGKAHKGKRYDDEPIGLALFNNEAKNYRTFVWYKNLNEAKRDIRTFISDLESVYQMLDDGTYERMLKNE